MGEYHEMLEGPKHMPHVRQVQVGWLGQSGAFYPWPTTPTRDQEPGSYGPVFIDEEEGPPLPSEAEVVTLRGIAKRLADGWVPRPPHRSTRQPAFWRLTKDFAAAGSTEWTSGMSPAEVHAIYGTEEESDGSG